MQQSKFARTLLDLRNELQWVDLLGWSDEQLASVPVYEEDPVGGERINLTDVGGTALGVTSAESGGPTSANVRSIRNLWVVRDEVPAELYERLEAISRDGMTGFGTGEPGERHWPEQHA